MKAFMLRTGSGPLMVLTSHPTIVDSVLETKFEAMGIDKFIAYEVDRDAVETRYEHSFANILKDLEHEEDIRVLDFNGHQIMANFSLEELGDPIKFGG